MAALSVSCPARDFWNPRRVFICWMRFKSKNIIKLENIKKKESDGDGEHNPAPFEVRQHGSEERHFCPRYVFANVSYGSTFLALSITQHHVAEGH